jgi:phosphoglycolate phosphatase-like HAD superfamily hydrolase
VVFDLDGVLADAAGRQHFIDGSGRRDWDAFFEACGDDPLIEDVAQLLGLLDPGLVIVLLTGRPVVVRDNTIGWLEHHQLRWDLLVMRSFGDYSAAGPSSGSPWPS